MDPTSDAANSGPAKAPTTSAARRHRREIVVASVFAALIVLLVGARIALPYVLLRVVNHKLLEDPRAIGHVRDLEVSLYRCAYTLRGVTMTMRDAPHDAPPLLDADEVDLALHWRALWRGHVVGAVEARRMTVRVYRAPETGKKATAMDPVSVQRAVKRLMPFRINHVVIRDGTVRYVDATGKHKVSVDFENVHAVATNLTNSERLAGSLIASLDVAGGFYGNGKVKVHADIDPFAARPTFTYDGEAIDMPLTKLNDITDEKLKFTFAAGTLSVYSEARAKDGVYEGYVKPFLRGVQVQKEDEPAWKQIWGQIVESVGKVLESRRHHRVASKIPFHGTLDKQSIDVVTSLSTLLQNAWIRALRPVIDGTVTDMVESPNADLKVREGEKQTKHLGGAATRAPPK